MNNTFINQEESIYSKNFERTLSQLIKKSKNNKINNNKSIISLTTIESTKSYLSILEEEIKFNEEILFCKNYYLFFLITIN